MDFTWAQPFPELHRKLCLFQQVEVADPITYKYKSLPTILQEGPQCGLVAVAMCMNSATKETVQGIFERAKQRSYTLNGEMFSAKEMCCLAQEFITCEVRLFAGDLNSDTVKDYLLDGGHMLVPYDCDKNHSPCCLNGHSAHWAAISGAIQTIDDFYVLAKHGKSKNVALWKLADLAESNLQLHEFSPDRKLQQIEYKLPIGGIAGENGLLGQSVLITNNILE